uniref:Mitochondrial import receptor subunit TOM70 n=2 Tax=Plectus sambesii TaxID=2011161 RepID=A0A914XJT0_9BILA
DNPKRVYDDCSEAITNNHKYAKAYLRRAKAAEKLLDYDAAVDDYTTACILEGFQQQKSTEDADKALKTLAEIKAKDMYQARGEHTLPLSNVFVESYLSSFCEDPILNSLDNIAQGEAHSGYVSALIALKQKRYSDVVKDCTRELEQHADESHWLPEATLLRATFALIQGNAAMASGDFERFFALMNELPEEERNKRRKLKANAHVKRGSYHMQLGRKDESMEDFRMAEQTDPDNADVYHHRGQLLILLGEVEKAPADFDKCVKLRPDFAVAKAQSCYAMYRKAMVDNSPSAVTTAIVRFEQVVQDFPDCAEGYALLGQVYTERDNCGDAKDMFEKALRLQPNNANILVHMGMLELQKSGDSPSEDDFNRATELMLRATKVDAHCEFAYETLGQLEVQRGRVRQATEYFDRALNLARTELELTHVFGLRLAARSQIVAAERLGISLPG